MYQPAAGGDKTPAGYTASLFRNSKAFREEALARRSRPEPLDDRLQVTAPHEWVVLTGVGLTLLALLVWGVSGRVERSLSVDVVLVQPGGRHAVTSPVSGDVVEVLAEVGDFLGVGQEIARVRPLEDRREARITERIVDAVEDELRGDAAALREALLAAARNQLGAVEMRAGESIVAPREGTLVAHGLTPGRPVRAGETVARIRGRSAGAWQALAFVSSDDAGRLAGGMDADVRVALPGRPAASALAARVAEVSPRPAAAPEWLAGLGLSTPAPAHLLRLVLRDPPRQPLDGAGGRARIVLGRQSPAALLLAGGSG